MSNVPYTVQLPTECFQRETLKAYCFQLEGGKYVNIPKSQISDYEHNETCITFECPGWLIDANNLEFFVVD